MVRCKSDLVILLLKILQGLLTPFKVKVKCFLKLLRGPNVFWLSVHLCPHLPLSTNPLSSHWPFCTPSHVSILGFCNGTFFYLDHSFQDILRAHFFTSFKTLFKCHLCSEAKPKLTIENFFLHQYSNTSISSLTLFFP